jgi:membrane protein YqaA with SNARE-associated domain
LTALLDQVWPYALMCGWAFLAATILPLSSEVWLLGQIKAGLGDPATLVAAATLGNTGGAGFNWWLGRWLMHFQGHRWFPFSPRTIETATARFNRFGLLALLFSWLPFVGDPLTLVAGMLRVPLGLFVPLVALGRLARYLVVALAS